MSYDLHRLLTHPHDTPTPWIDGGVLWKGAILMFGGSPGVGKTYMALEMIRNMAEGGNFLGMPHKCIERPKKILYLDGEAGLELMIPRVKQVFAGCKDLEPGFAEVDCHAMNLSLDRPEGRDWFFKKLQSYNPVPDIVVIDPLSYFLAADDSKNEAAQFVYQTLVQAQQKINPDMSFVLSHHYRKAPSGRAAEGYDPLDAQEFRGASRWLGMAWTVLTLNRLHPLNPDKGWNLDARFAKLRASAPVEEFQYLRMDGATMRCGVRRPPGATWN